MASQTLDTLDSVAEYRGMAAVTLERFALQLLAATEAEIRKQLGHLSPRELQALASPEQAAAEFVRSLADASVWNREIGPVFTISGLSNKRGVSRQSIHEQIKTDRIIHLTTADGIRVIPAAFLDSSLKPMRALVKPFVLLRDTSRDEWTAAAALTASAPALGGESMVEFISKGGRAIEVHNLAHQIARTWSQ